MSKPRIFATGCTGYIGGDALYVLYEAHPDWDYTCMVRDTDKGAKLAAKHASVRLVYGDLDNTKMIEEEARRADVVLNFANADSVSAATAIAAGMSSKDPSTPSGHWIHTSGTGILSYSDMNISSYGNPSSKMWDDVKDIAAITSIPDNAPHRNVDKIVLAAGTSTTGVPVKTAIVCPPTIYGTGRGSGNTKSIQVPSLARCFLQRKEGFIVGEGKAKWNNVHIHDLSQLYLKLAEDAVSGGGKASWGQEGYYFAENGEHKWADICTSLTITAHTLSLLPTPNCSSLSATEANALHEVGAILWGTNSRCRASRARRAAGDNGGLGWKPKGPSLESTLEEALKREEADAGLRVGHAAVAAGDV